MVRLEPFTDTNADLGTDDRADEQEQGKDEVDGMVHRCLKDGYVDAREQDLKQACPHDDMHGHTEQVDHDGDHDEAAADAQEGGENPDQNSQDERHQHRQRDTAPLEVDLPGEAADQASVHRWSNVDLLAFSSAP